MKLIFGASRMPGSLLLQFFTFSRWSHVGIVYGDFVIEARFPRVRMTTVAEFQAHYPRWEFAELPCADEGAAEAFARSRIGRLYDLGGLLAFPFQNRAWETSSRDFCSALPILPAGGAGTPYVREGARRGVTGRAPARRTRSWSASRPARPLAGRRSPRPCSRRGAGSRSRA